MAKKLVKKRKIKVFGLLIVLLILGGLIFGIFSYLDSDIKNIIIEGNNYLNDDYIIEKAGIKDYPSFYFTSTLKAKNKLLKSPNQPKSTNIYQTISMCLALFGIFNTKENKTKQN